MSDGIGSFCSISITAHAHPKGTPVPAIPLDAIVKMPAAYIDISRFKLPPDDISLLPEQNGQLYTLCSFLAGSPLQFRSQAPQMTADSKLGDGPPADEFLMDVDLSTKANVPDPKIDGLIERVLANVNGMDLDEVPVDDGPVVQDAVPVGLDEVLGQASGAVAEGEGGGADATDDKRLGELEVEDQMSSKENAPPRFTRSKFIPWSRQPFNNIQPSTHGQEPGTFAQPVNIEPEEPSSLTDPQTLVTKEPVHSNNTDEQPNGSEELGTKQQSTPQDITSGSKKGKKRARIEPDLPPRPTRSRTKASAPPQSGFSAPTPKKTKVTDRWFYVTETTAPPSASDSPTPPS
jgi:hypothetical protein